MSPKRRKRLQLVLLILLLSAGAVFFLLQALGENLNHYYELGQIKQDKSLSLRGKPIRVGGMIEKNSIKRTEGSLKISFVITNFTDRLQVEYEGVLPDLFKEGQGVLAKGTLVDEDRFVATEILAKHDENYLPKEVADELKKSENYQHYKQGKEN